MKLEELINEKIQKAPEMEIKSWLDREAEIQKRIELCDYYDDTDMVIAREVIRDILFLKKELKHIEEGKDAFLSLCDTASKYNKAGATFYYRLADIQFKKQLEGLKNALAAIAEIVSDDTVPDDDLRACIDSNGCVHIHSVE